MKSVVRAVYLCIFWAVTVLPSAAAVTCNTFEVSATLADDSLTITVNTDLPDVSVVSVAVSRTYYEEKNPEAYSILYFSEDNYVEEWRGGRVVDIDNKTWIGELERRLENMSRKGLPFKVDSVSDLIDIKVKLPVNQPDPGFGMRNFMLTGKAVPKEGLRELHADTTVKQPINADVNKAGYAPSLDPMRLDIGPLYIISKPVDLMPSYNRYGRPTGKLKKKVDMPAGCRFRVKEATMYRGVKWYKVSAYNMYDVSIGTGWTSSVELINQTLDVK